MHNVTDMTDISVSKFLQTGVKSLGEHAILQNQAFFCVHKLVKFDRVVTFFSPSSFDWVPKLLQRLCFCQSNLCWPEMWISCLCLFHHPHDHRVISGYVCVCGTRRRAAVTNSIEKLPAGRVERERGRATASFKWRSQVPQVHGKKMDQFAL